MLLALGSMGDNPKDELSDLHLAALALLRDSEGADAEALARALGISTDAAAELLEELELLGLLESFDVQ